MNSSDRSDGDLRNLERGQRRNYDSLHIYLNKREVDTFTKTENFLLYKNKEKMNAEIGTRKRTRFVSESAYQAASLFSGTVSHNLGILLEFGTQKF